MSVVVMHMQMPSECLMADESINRNCPMDRVWCAEKFAPYDMTYLQRLEEQRQKLPSWCPLRPLPEKHGRLIDADKLEGAGYALARLHIDSAAQSPKQMIWMEMISFDEAPTFLEAEGGSDE